MKTLAGIAVILSLAGSAADASSLPLPGQMDAGIERFKLSPAPAAGFNLILDTYDGRVWQVSRPTWVGSYGLSLSPIVEDPLVDEDKGYPGRIQLSVISLLPWAIALFDSSSGDLWRVQWHVDADGTYSVDERSVPLKTPENCAAPACVGWYRKGGEQ